MAKQGLPPPEELLGPECPEAAEHLWRWFSELNRVRSGNGFGGNPIGYADIADWARFTCTRPGAMEVDWLLDLDAAFRAASAEARPKQRRDKRK